MTITVEVEGGALGASGNAFQVFLDGELVTTEVAAGAVSVGGVLPGLRHIAALLVDGEGVALPNPEALDGIYVKVVGPCDSAAECDDGNGCSIDSCKPGAGVCAYGHAASCCDHDLECDNGWFCEGGTCRECVGAAGCDDGDLCTSDFCDAEGQCLHVPLLDCCQSDADCDDGLFCTIDQCEGTVCVSAASPAPGCCDFDSDCVSADPCLPTFCYKAPSKGTQFCRTGPTIPGCCDADTDCDDANPCTVNLCLTGDGDIGACAFEPDPEQPECCLSKLDCDDGDPSTVDGCVDNLCLYQHDELFCELPLADAVVLNELQPHPGPLLDGQAEFIELYNPSTSFIDLDGYQLETSAGGFHTIAAPGGELLMVPGAYLVLGPVIDKAAMGFTAHYAYGDDLELLDPTSAGGPVEMTLIVYDAEGDLVDEISYASESWPFVDGRSLELRNAYLDNDDPAAWRVAGTHPVASKNKTYGPSANKTWGSPRQSNFSSVLGLPDASCKKPEGSTICTEQRCGLTGLCEFPSAEGCCLDDGGCEDGDPCTESECDPTIHQCTTPQEVAACCLADSECDDGNDCNLDRCLGNRCRYSPYVVEGCCYADADCEDGDPCTLNACDVEDAACALAVPLGLPCCAADADCEDGDPETLDSCDLGENACVYADDPDFCQSLAAPCDDGNPCTGDACDQVAQTCQHTPVEGCCLTAADCPDAAADLCSEVVCDPATNTCAQAPIPACCLTKADCDDGDGCTDDWCNGLHHCHYTQRPACCQSDADCNDGDACTGDACVDGDCAHTHTPDCCHPWDAQGQLVTACGALPDECDLWACPDSTCVLLTGGGCCETHAECDDGNSCTLNVCQADLTCKTLPFTTAGCCSTNFNCDADEYCDLATHACTPKQDLGGLCIGDPDCVHGTCVLSECVCPAGTTGADCDEPLCEPACDPASEECTFVGCVETAPSWTEDVQPILEAKCGACHDGLPAGSCEGATCFVHFHADVDKPSLSCPGKTVAECALERVQNGTEPNGAGCTGDPALDAGNHACLTGWEQATVQAWLDDGAGCGPDGEACDFGDVCVMEGACAAGACVGGYPCDHGGVCAPYGDGYACECPPGYAGFDCEHDVDECGTLSLLGPGTLPIHRSSNADVVILHEPATRDGCVARVTLRPGTTPNGGGYGWQARVYDLVGTSAILRASAPLPPFQGATPVEQTLELPGCLPIAAGQFAAVHNPLGDTELTYTLGAGQGPGYLFVSGKPKEKIDGEPAVYHFNPGDVGLRVELSHEFPCANDAICLDLLDDYACDCLPGYEGGDCETDIDECAPAPCQNGSLCVDLVDDYACECLPGFSGKDCQADDDDCQVPHTVGPEELPADQVSVSHVIVHQDPSPVDGCVGEVLVRLGEAPPGGGQAWQVRVYDMAGGFATLEGAQSVAVDGATLDPQVVPLMPCLPILEGQHVGLINLAGRTAVTYTDSGGSGYWYLTEPPAPDVGSVQRLSSWSGSPGWRALIYEAACKNDSLCVDLVDDYDCACLPGFEGGDCEVDIDDCAAAPCQNGAECVDLVDDYACACPPGFLGEDCEIDIDDCELAPCENGATCVDVPDDYLCACPGGFIGKNCQVEVDECDTASIVGAPKLPAADLADAQVAIPEGPALIGGCVESVTVHLGGGPPGAGLEWEARVYAMSGDAATLVAALEFEVDPADLDPQTVELTSCLPVLAGQHVGVVNRDGATRLAFSPADTDHDAWGYWFLDSQPGSAVGGSSEVLAHSPGEIGFQAHLVHPQPCHNGAACNDLVDAYSCTCLPGFSGDLCGTDVDDCAPNPCKNGATCKDLVDAYTCTCLAGFSGLHCEVNDDDCDPAPCENGATCADLVDDFHCACPDGFQGKRCETNIDECGADPCLNGAACVDLVYDYQCLCLPGFAGKSCGIDLDDCLVGPCHNGGACTDLVDDFFCTCPPGYVGELCETDADDCAKASLLGVSSLPSLGSSPYHLVIQPQPSPISGCVDKVTLKLGNTAPGGGAGFEVRVYDLDADAATLVAKQALQVDGDALGTQGIPVSPCVPIAQGEHVALVNTFGATYLTHDDDAGGDAWYWAAAAQPGDVLGGDATPMAVVGGEVALSVHVAHDFPCKNGSACVDEVDDYACECLPGFFGKHCDNDLDECDPNPCQHQGTCVDLVDDFACICQPGFAGKSCELNVDECAAQPCLNGSQCVDLDNDYACLCLPGFSGKDCDDNDDDCDPDPCLNGSACVDGVDDYDCLCPPGFSGKECQVDDDDCLAGPCDNGSACVDLVNDYACECLAGYAGKACEVDIDDCAEAKALGFFPLPQSGLVPGHGVVNADPLYRDGCIASVSLVFSSVPAGLAGALELRVYELDGDEASLVSAAPFSAEATATGEEQLVAFEPCVPIAAGQHAGVYNTAGLLRLAGNPLQGAGFWRLDGPSSAEVGGAPETLAAAPGAAGFRANVVREPSCLNGATCHDEVDAFSCECTPGFYGTLCEIDADDCDPSPCQNGGECLDDVAGFSCTCPPGYAGTICETNVDECDPDPCKNGATCVDLVNAFECECVIGFVGFLCEVNVDDCAGDPCQHEGVCIDGADEYTCLCQPGYEGGDCEVDIDECAPEPCQNGAGCVDLVNDFACDCLAGFEGDLCEVDIDDCDPSPCKNGAECIDLVDDWFCDCPPGFAGKNCEVNEDECDPDPCQNGSSCVDLADDYACECLPGFVGKDCQVNKDECYPNPCKNAAPCVDQVDDYQCLCLPGFSGKDCDNNDDDCDPDPCQNAAPCVDGVDDFACQCLPGFSGKTCDVNDDECLPDPCQSGAACVDLVDDFHCDCPAGFVGELCEVDGDDCQEGDYIGPASPPTLGAATIDLVVLRDAVEADGCVESVTLRLGNVAPGGGAGFEIRGWEMFADEGHLVAAQPLAVNGSTLGQQVIQLAPCFPVEAGWFLGVANRAGDTKLAQKTSGGAVWELDLPLEVFLDDEVGGPPLALNPSPRQVALGFTLSHPTFCENGSVCVDHVDGYSCDCLPGWAGTLCETDIDGCLPNPCQSGGVCVDLVDGFECDCPVGFEGALCETNIDECAPAPCDNGATCVDGVDSFSCECLAGFEGTLCETDIDECAPEPCDHGGVCSDLVDDYACACPDGFEGKSCETNIDECAAGPCLHGGQCVDGVFSYSCVCPAGFLGATCEVDVDFCATENALGPATLPTAQPSPAHLIVNQGAAPIDGCVESVTLRLGANPPGFGQGWSVRVYEMSGTAATLKAKRAIAINGFSLGEQTVGLSTCLPVAAGQNVAIVNTFGPTSLATDPAQPFGYWAKESAPAATIDGPPETLLVFGGAPAWRANVAHPDPCPVGQHCIDGLETFRCEVDACACDAGMLIASVIDGDLATGAPRGVELYVCGAIDDLSRYGLGVANNGLGSDGQEFTLPAGTAWAGTHIYVGASAAGWVEAFGFAPDFVHGSLSVNGDDAVELFEDGAVIDTWGDPNTDGTGTAWDYTDSYAARVVATGPNGGTFDPVYWEIGGAGALAGLDAAGHAAALDGVFGRYTCSQLGGCCEANGTAGCDEPACQALICDVDGACCEVAWDATCAGLALDNCDGCGVGLNCCIANGTPGCNDAACEATVCAADPACCDVVWDGGCAAQAAVACDVCQASGDCCTSNGTPGCQVPGCLFAVCAEDEYCCDSAWDPLCAEIANDICPVCVYEGPCCWGHDGRGCDDLGCSATVCAVDATCCDVVWDAACGVVAIETCGFAACENFSGDCCFGGGSPGCEEPTCAAAVCTLDPFCCLAKWDDGCAELSRQTCAACDFGGNCCDDNGTPGCDDVDCSEAVCGADATCCDTAWDALCAAAAVQLCAVCQFEGTCCATNDTPGCDDIACVNSICALDPTCCDSAWDAACAGAAYVLCDACQFEGGCCYGNGTAGCDDEACATTVCEVDAACCDVGWDDACAVAAVAACDVCAGLGGDCCAGHGGLGCDDVACVLTVCAADPSCCELGWDQTCADLANQGCFVCTSTGDCCTANGTPGCEDAACAATVCGTDPACCALAWDTGCAAAAGALCDVCLYTGFCCSANGTPGCSDATCREAVCGQDPTCCSVAWDAACMDLAFASCDQCQFEGGCCSANGTPGCDDPACVGEVCGLDELCCEVAWDETCRDAALVACDVCAFSGDCCIANGTVGCADPACVVEVCGADAFCCESLWDTECVTEAMVLCAACDFDGDCCEAGSTPGCADAQCAAAVCSADPFCCATNWDSVCAAKAEDLCIACSYDGGCCYPNDSPGCNDGLCLEAVCEDDPACCLTFWDTACAEAALATCSACVFEGGCCHANGSPGCGDTGCVGEVCAVDPGCCDVTWDAACADLAVDLCSGVCPYEGDCCVEGDSIGCDNPDCVELICGDDPLCCDTVWDALCAETASTTCVVCTGEVFDGDCCSANGSAGCNNGTCNLSVCGADPYCCDVDWDATCAEAAILDCQVCAIPSYDGDCCVANGSEGCGDASCTIEVCDADPTCCEVEWDAGCAVAAGALCDVCDFDGGCCHGNGSPGCSAPSCVAEVCAFDAYCCDLEWDADCAVAANLVCGDVCPYTGGCCDANASAGCTDDACAGEVCGLDAYCCELDWDTACASAADAMCEVCTGFDYEGDCCAANGSPGCEDADCSSLICALEGFCCDVGWDAGCADDAVALCAACSGTGSTCCTAHLGLGCDDAPCQSAVCALDPFCCDTSWDGSCMEAALVDCAVCQGVVQSDCCASHTGSGCDDATCVALICSFDAACCDVLWDSGCAANANQACAVCAAGTSDCCGSHVGSGCDDVVCEAEVCLADPSCCDSAWDFACADLANAACAACGVATGSCCVDNGTPGCVEATCADDICSVDDYCCAIEWDAACADAAIAVCPVCAFDGGCCAENGTPGCDDAQCVIAVCGDDAFCCDVEWDDLCAESALALCAACAFEGDCCVANGSEGCEDGACSAQICAQDPACCDLGWDQACADAALAGCAACVFDGSCCTPNPGAGCDDAACMIALCADDGFCCELGWDATCAATALTTCAACSFDGNCCAPSATPGCEDTACAADVCSVEPSCCDTAWDQVCVELAIAGCSACTFDGGCCYGNLSPGCDDPDCAAAVCGADGFCCTTAWDDDCASQAAAACTTCAADTSCCYPGTAPGCEDVACVLAICDQDTLCCDVQWDAVCAEAALAVCDACAYAGDCCAGNGSPGCDTPACVVEVCGADPFCCDFEWDSVCAQAAAGACASCPN